MYQSDSAIASGSKQQLLAHLLFFLSQKKKLYCKSLGRCVHFDKLPDALIQRKDARRRLQVFGVAVDIVRMSKSYTRKNIDGCNCYEFVGCDSNDQKVIVHLREEISQKDRKLYFVSCF